MENTAIGIVCKHILDVCGMGKVFCSVQQKERTARQPQFTHQKHRNIPLCRGYLLHTALCMRLSHLYRTFFASAFSLLDIACVFIDFITISSTPFGAMNAILVVSCKWLVVRND